MRNRKRKTPTNNSNSQEGGESKMEKKQRIKRSIAELAKINLALIENAKERWDASDGYTEEGKNVRDYLEAMEGIIKRYLVFKVGARVVVRYALAQNEYSDYYKRCQEQAERDGDEEPYDFEAAVCFLTDNAIKRAKNRN
jgi:hypothetical protein